MRILTLEHQQLGAGTLDGVVITAKMLQAWAESFSDPANAITEDQMAILHAEPNALPMDAIGPLD